MSVLGLIGPGNKEAYIDVLQNEFVRLYSHATPFSNDTHHSTPKTFQTDNGELLMQRITISKDGRGNNIILGQGGYGTAYQAKLGFDKRDAMNVVVKFPTFLIELQYITISESGKLQISADQTILKKIDKEKLSIFYNEIDNILKLRKGETFLRLKTPNATIRSSVLSTAFKEEQQLITDFKGHEFIHRILDMNEGILPCLISEYCDGDLFKINHVLKEKGLLGSSNNIYCANNNCISEAWEKAIYEIYQGISYMHSVGMAHNDIKPDNIFFIIRNINPLEITYRVSDFGLCSDNKPLLQARGTKLYMSTEMQIRFQIAAGTEHYTGKIFPFFNDAYSMGLTCLELLFMSSDSNHDNSQSTADVYRYIIGCFQRNPHPSSYNSPQSSLTEMLLGLCLCQVETRYKIFKDGLSKYFGDLRFNTH